MEQYNRYQITKTLKMINFYLEKCVNVKPVLKEGTSSYLFNNKLIFSLTLSKESLLHHHIDASKEEIEEALDTINIIYQKYLNDMSTVEKENAMYKQYYKMANALQIIIAFLTIKYDVKTNSEEG